MSTLATFSRFAKSGNAPKLLNQVKTAVVYTRVSGKEQYDKNLSLATQRRTIEEYAQCSGIRIEDYFGGTYESAKTDGRKEFQRMLDFIKKHNAKSTMAKYPISSFICLTVSAAPVVGLLNLLRI